MNEPLVKFNKVTRKFGALKAVNNVSLEVYPGEVLALLGENGAGKSTLMKTLYGIHPPCHGEIRILGKPSKIRGPADAMQQGIGMVFQHFSLLPALSVRDNLLVAWPETSFWISQKNSANDAVLKNLARIAPRISPHKIVAELSVGERQLVELAKVLNIAARIVILDEPTSVLAPQEARHLHTFVRQMAADGVAVVFITHKLADVRACADRIAIMRRGELVDVSSMGQHSEQHIVQLMMGQSANHQHSRAPVKPEKHSERLKLVNLCATAPGSKLQSINLSVAKGEVVAIAGVVGNGQTLLAEVVAGLHAVTSGDVLLDNVSVARQREEQSLCSPIAYIPEQPKDNAIVSELTLSQNLQLRSYAKAEQTYANVKKQLKKFAVNPPEPERIAGTLSGGNLQKLVIAREFAVSRPAVLACYPTMGLDLNAIELVYREMFEQAKKGAAVIWISEDIDHMLQSAHRIAVLREGKLVAVLDNDGCLSRDTIGALMIGSDVKEAAVAA